MSVKNFLKVSAIVAVCAVAYVNNGMRNDKVADDATAKTWICKTGSSSNEIKFRVTKNKLVINDNYEGEMSYVDNSSIIHGGYRVYDDTTSKDRFEAAMWQFSGSDDFEPSSSIGLKSSCKIVKNDNVER